MGNWQRSKRTPRWTRTPQRAPAPECRHHKYQRTVFHRDDKHVVYVKGRRAGGTYGAVLRIVELAYERPGSRHLWVDLLQRNIRRVVGRDFRRALEGRPVHFDATALSLRFEETGATCDFGSAQYPERLEGFGYDCIWINEAGHLLRNEHLYFETLLPMVMESPAAQIFLVGAPKGRGLFERMYGWGQDAELRDKKEWWSERHPSEVNPRVDAAWLERVRRTMPERVWRQEILAEFVDDAGSVFREVDACATAVPEAAPQPGVAYVIGVDLGRYQDWTAAWVGRADTSAAVACERYGRQPWAEQRARLAALSDRYGGATLWVDATGVGDPVCEALEDEGLPVQRVRFTADSKQRLVDRLAVSLERGTLHFVPHEQTLRELHAFRYERTPTGNVRTGGAAEHDDCVMALALCCWGMATQGDRDFILGAPMVTRELD